MCERDVLCVWQVVVDVKHQRRGSLHVELECPSGTRSTLATPRAADKWVHLCLPLDSHSFILTLCLYVVCHFVSLFFSVYLFFHSYPGDLLGDKCAVCMLMMGKW